MAVCTFFGHSDCCDLQPAVLRQAIEELIDSGVDTFYVGHQGRFDAMVLSCLKELQKTHPRLRFWVVLATLPKTAYDTYEGRTLYPEGLEIGPPRFAIDRRNRWMLAQADYCLCYVNRSWGGACKFAREGKRRSLTVINLGTLKL